MFVYWLVFALSMEFMDGVRYTLATCQELLKDKITTSWSYQMMLVMAEHQARACLGEFV